MCADSEIASYAFCVLVISLLTDSGLRPDERTSDLDSLTEVTRTQKKKKKKKKPMDHSFISLSFLLEFVATRANDSLVTRRNPATSTSPTLDIFTKGLFSKDTCSV